MTRVPRSHQEERRLSAALGAILPPSVNVTVRQRPDGDFEAVVGVTGSYRVRRVGRGWPREIQRALNTQPRPDIVAAPAMSEGARHLLRSERVGWLDETGSAELDLDRLVVSRSGTGRPSLPLEHRWRPATFGVVEAVLCGVSPTVEAVKEATGYSTEWARVALSSLQEWGFLEQEARRGPRSARYLQRRDELLDTYAEQIAAAGNQRGLELGVLWRDPLEGLAATGAAWSGAHIDWAATGAAAAAVLAPHLTGFNRTEVFIDGSSTADLLVAANAARLKPIEGGRLVLRPFPSKATKALSSGRPIPTAPWPRVFADLRTLGVRGEEAAEHLRAVMASSTSS